MSTVGARTHVVVIFGGESAEHDVSCVTAAHVIRALDPQKYRVTTIGIDRSGKWLTATDAMKALERGPAFIPERLVAEGDPTSITPIVEAASAHSATVMFPLLPPAPPLPPKDTFMAAVLESEPPPPPIVWA